MNWNAQVVYWLSKLFLPKELTTKSIFQGTHWPSSPPEFRRKQSTLRVTTKHIGLENEQACG